MAIKKISILLEDLLEAGCHFGHQSRRWHPKMAPFIWTVREGVHIFDLAKTKAALEKAAAFASATAAQGGLIVFVGTKSQARSIIQEEAKRCRMPFVSQRWLGGTITNWEQIKKSLDKLTEMIKKRENNEYDKYTKKERLLIDREINRLQRFLGGLISLKELPEVLFVVDCKKEESAIKEAKMKNIKIIGIVDTNTDPTGVDFPIPANDDAVASIKFIVSKIAQAIRYGQGKS